MSLSICYSYVEMNHFTFINRFGWTTCGVLGWYDGEWECGSCLFMREWCKLNIVCMISIKLRCKSCGSLWKATAWFLLLPQGAAEHQFDMRPHTEGVFTSGNQARIRVHLTPKSKVYVMNVNTVYRGCLQYGLHQVWEQLCQNTITYFCLEWVV